MKRIFHILFFLLLVFLPSQIGKHFWFAQSLVLGRRVDYLSPTISLVDLILLACFFLAVYLRPFKFSRQLIICVSMYILLFLFFVFPSQNVLSATYYWLRLVELGMFCYLVYVRQPKYQDFIFPIGISVFYIVFLQLLQFFAQSSLNGWWYFLGERTFTIETPQIAHLLVSGRIFLRPYSVFPHPNVLGGYLTVLLPLFLSWKSTDSFGYLFKRLVLGLLFLGIFLSFSRTAWVVSLLTLLMYLLLLGQSKRKKNILLFLIAVFVMFAFEELLIGRVLNIFTVDQESITQRQELALAASSMFRRHPVFGVGFLNFIPVLPQYFSPPFLLQPVHSIFLLVLAETGLVGFLLFLTGIVWTVRRFMMAKSSPFLVSLISLLTLGLFDHYFLTISQGLFIFALIVGLGLFSETKVQ